MSGIRQHVVLLNFFREEPYALLASDPEVLLTVITQHHFRDRYPADADVRVVADLENITMVGQAVVEAARKAPIDRIVPTAEPILQGAAYARSLFGMGPDGFDQVNRLTNKFVMKQTVAAAGISVTPYALAHSPGHVAEVAEEIGWPVVVKPVLGGGCWNVRRVEDTTALHALLNAGVGEEMEAAGVPLLVERYVPLDHEYHCDGVVVDGEVAFAEVSRYLRPLLVQKGGTLTSSTLPPDSPRRQEISELHRRAVEALGMTSGVTHMEIFESQGRLLFGECAGRPAGAHLARNIELSRGVDLWRCFIDLAVGRKPEIRSKQPQDIYTVVHFPTVRGRVTHISAPEDFAQVPDLVEVDISTKLGERSPAAISTSHISGSVIFKPPDESVVEERLKLIESIFTLQVEPAWAGRRE